MVTKKCRIYAACGVSQTPIYKKESEDFVKKEIFIDRHKRFDLFQGRRGILILTGNSGIGKSYLLRQFVDGLNEDEYAFIENNYFYDWDYDQFTGKKYVILDQFEKAVFVANFKNKILNLKKLTQRSDALIIISVRKEYFADIYKAFKFDKRISIKWLDYDKAEIKEIKDYLQKVIGKCNAENEKYQLYNDMIKDLQEKNISLIQLSYISKLILETPYTIKSVNQRWIKEKNYNILVYSFLERLIDNFLYMDLAYYILYLMCRDNMGIYINQVMDFQNISMQSLSRIENTLQFLQKQKLIKKVQADENVRYLPTEEYEISHDYLMELLDTLCISKLDANIRNNIEFYNKNYQEKRNKKQKKHEIEEESYVEKINKRYYSFLKSKSKSYINVLLYIMMIGICLLNGYNLTINAESNSCLILAGINIVVGESIYYIYNYYYQFMRIFGSRYIISILFGTLCCWLAYIFIDYWALCLGAEILLMGVLMIFVNSRVRKSEKKFFFTRFLTFTGIGIITIILGVCFRYYVGGNIRLALPLFILYGIYMILGIIGHINRVYILALIGKTLLIGKGLGNR